MGDRVSIQFEDECDKSPVLFHHWGGRGFVRMAVEYAERLRERNCEQWGTPLTRCEAQTTLVDFIRHVTTGMDRVESDLYLGVDENDGDNSDNGHWVIKITRGVGVEVFHEGEKCKVL
jgi:hypothetical protein